MSRRGPLHRDRSLTKGSLWEDIKQELGRNDAEDEARAASGHVDGWGAGSARAASQWRAENRAGTRQAARALIRENRRHFPIGTQGGIKKAQELSQEGFARLGSQIESLKGSAKLSTHWQPGDEV